MTIIIITSSGNTGPLFVVAMGVLVVPQLSVSVAIHRLMYPDSPIHLQLLFLIHKLPVVWVDFPWTHLLELGRIQDLMLSWIAEKSPTQTGMRDLGQWIGQLLARVQEL